MKNKIKFSSLQEGSEKAEAFSEIYSLCSKHGITPPKEVVKFTECDSLIETEITEGIDITKKQDYTEYVIDLEGLYNEECSRIKIKLLHE